MSARTLTMRIARWTEAVRSSSTTLSTSTSLLSCLVTCSNGKSSTSTTTVMRDTSGCSVGPTARESMLNPRRENSPAIRVSTPGLFSTRTDSVCLLISYVPSVFAVPHRREPACGLDLVIADSGGDHRPHHRVAVDDEVHHHRNVVDLHRRLDGRVDLSGRVTAHSHACLLYTSDAA